MTRRLTSLAAFGLVIALLSRYGHAAEPTPEQAKFFTEKVRPIFESLEFLGRERTMTRVERCLGAVG